MNKFKGASSIMLIVAIAAIWIVSTVFLAPIIGVQFSLVAGLLFSVGLFFIGSLLDLGTSINPLDKLPSVLIGIVLIVFSLGMVGVNLVQGIEGAISGTAVGGLPSQPSQPTEDVGIGLSACEASVSSDIRGTSATVTLNAYDLEADSPYASVVDAGTVYVFRTDSIAGSDNSNFVASTGDTSSNGMTGFKVGEVISLAGGGTRNWTDAKNGVCIKGQQQNINLDTHTIRAQGTESLKTTLYDDTGSTALGAGGVNTDYTIALGSSETKKIYWKIENNGTNEAVYLSSIGLATGSNISSVKPTSPDDGLFTKVSSPLFLTNVILYTNSSGSDGLTQTRTYTIYKLNNPKVLHEFESVKYALELKASANDPVGSAGTGDASEVYGIAIDQTYVRGSDGKMYLDFYDHTSTEGNVGLAEDVDNPCGADTGFCLTVT